ncbi:hypothetical protein DINM_002167 [Dirofilaria immitis]|nr:hypothetical protein [Dirofilaria immitis]
MSVLYNYNQIAGLMDESVHDQPTLKRFSRYNQSMHSRSSVQMYDSKPGSSQQQLQQQQQQPHTCSKVQAMTFVPPSFSLTPHTDYDSFHHPDICENASMIMEIGHCAVKGAKMRPSVHDVTVVKTGNSLDTIHTSYGNFTRPLKGDSSIVAGQLERIVPIEWTTSNGQS